MAKVPKEAADRTPFGERMTAARAHAGLGQGEAARLIGVKQPTLWELENVSNKSGFTPQAAAVYKVNASWLATGKGRMIDPSPGVRARVAHIAEQLEAVESPEEFERACVLAEAFAALAQAGQLVEFSRALQIGTLLSPPTPAPQLHQSRQTGADH